MRGNPTVLTGPRGPMLPASEQAWPLPTAGGGVEAVAAAAMAAASMQPPAKRSPDEVIFGSRIRFYRIQITSPADQFEPVTGKVIRAFPKVAKFHEYQFRTTDPVYIAGIKSSKSYGIGRDCWDVEELMAEAKATAVSNVRAVMAADPSLKDRVLNLFAQMEQEGSQVIASPVTATVPIDEFNLAPRKAVGGAR